MRTRRRSGVSWLALGYLALVVYASLHPFGPWDWPAGLRGWDIVRLDWPRYWSQFDIWANALGYVPLGLLLFAAAWRSGAPLGGALLLALLLPSSSAYVLEVLQRFVALRQPSLADWALNSGGAALGCAMAAAAAWRGWLDRWSTWRERWFWPHSAGALALLALWPLGLLWPTPAPLAQGRFLPPLLAWLEELLAERGWLDQGLQLATLASGPEPAAVTLLGGLAPCLLLLAVARPGWHRLPLLLGVMLVGFGASSLAAMLSFGAPNSWSWLTPGTAVVASVGLLLALLCAFLPARVNAVLALPVLTGLILMVARLEPDPFLQASLQRWELGARVQLYGLLEWVGLLWPAVALAWLMYGLTRGGPPKITGFAASGPR